MANGNGNNKLSANAVLIAVVAILFLIILFVLGEHYVDGDGKTDDSLPIIMAIFAPTIVSIVALLRMDKIGQKAEENSRKLEVIKEQTNGGLRDNVKSALQESNTLVALGDEVRNAVKVALDDAGVAPRDIKNGGKNK